MDQSNFPKIVFVGAGAVGTSSCAWLSQKHTNVYLLARGKAVNSLRANGVLLYQGDRSEERETIPVNVIASLDEAADADVVIIATKLFNLNEAACLVRDQLGPNVLVVGMQNGRANQDILPRYFERVVYCVVGYNCWMDEPGVVGYQKRGPLFFGTPDGSLRAEMDELVRLFNPAIESVVSEHFQDVVHCKIAINLSNSVTTLVGLNRRAISNIDLFQNIISNTLYEGVQIIRAAGYQEVRMGGIPPWSTIWAAARLPHFISRGTFRRNIKKMVRSSMTQDLLFHRGHTELEYLNGYLLSLADQNDVKVPYNRAIYKLCKEKFSSPEFSPLDVKDVWVEVEKFK